MLHASIVPQNILEKLIPCSPTASPHAIRIDSVRRLAWRDDLHAIRVNRNFNTRSREKIAAVNPSAA